MEEERTKQNTENIGRNKKGVITGVVGMACNLSLGAAKIAAGILSGSVSVAADAANNLSDCFSSTVTTASFLISGKKPDKKHRHGHGRAEYIASFLISVIIIVIGIEFLISSVKKIMSPTPVETGVLITVILSVSIGVKAIMAVIYSVMAKKLGAPALKAARLDSLSDCFLTSVVLIGVMCSPLTSYPLDGIFGAAVSVFVVFGGIKATLETIGSLMGAGDKESERLRRDIENIVLSSSHVKGCHDLKLHDYGPNNVTASVDAEFDENMTIMEAHKIIDSLEQEVKDVLGAELVIHIDPIDISNPEIAGIRKTINEVLSYYHGSSVYELHVLHEEKKIPFYVRLPEMYHEAEETIRRQLTEAVEKAAAQKELEGYVAEINFEI